MPSNVPAANRRALALCAAAVLLTRLPWLGHDYGSDPDSYRVLNTARHLARGGEYQASRLPGYPAYEYLSALSAGSAPWVSNAVTALFSVAAFILFALILHALQVRRYLLLALGFAMVPVIYVSSCCTMDYVPSMTLMLAATYAVLRRRPILAGLLLGLAVGCRITAGALVLSLCLWMVLSLGVRRALLPCLNLGVTTLLIGALCFLPVYLVYGWGFFAFFDNDGYPPIDVVFARATTLVWGQIGFVALIALICAAPFYIGNARRMLLQPSARHALAMAMSVVALYLIAFLRLPDEAGYLVPLVPWVLVLVALLAPSSGLIALTAALLLSPWIAFHGMHPTLEGAILEDHLVRESQDQATHAVIEAVRALPGRAAVVSGWVLPRITLNLDGDRLGAHQFIYLVEDDDDYRHYVAEGRQIYYLPGVDLYESQAHQLELSELGAHQLDVPHERHRPASTGE
jgi:hypothetical protein